MDLVTRGMQTRWGGGPGRWVGSGGRVSEDSMERSRRLSPVSLHSDPSAHGPEASGNGEEDGACGAGVSGVAGWRRRPRGLPGLDWQLLAVQWGYGPGRWRGGAGAGGIWGRWAGRPRDTESPGREGRGRGVGRAGPRRRGRSRWRGLLEPSRPGPSMAMGASGPAGRRAARAGWAGVGVARAGAGDRGVGRGAGARVSRRGRGLRWGGGGSRGWGEVRGRRPPRGDGWPG